MPTAHLLIGRQSAGTAVGTGCLLGIATAIGMQALARLAPVTAELNRKTPQASMGPGEPSFDSLSHIEEQVPAVSHLQGLGSPDGSSSRVLGGAVTRDDANPGLPAQPRGDRCTGAVGEEVNDASLLQVDQNGAIGAPLLDGPYVDGPLLARLLNRILDRIVCGHMYGLLLRSHLTAAKMVSATRVPNRLAACHSRRAMRSLTCLGSIDHTICSCPCKIRHQISTGELLGAPRVRLISILRMPTRSIPPARYSIHPTP